jgi:hypothetical protein
MRLNNLESRDLETKFGVHLIMTTNGLCVSHSVTKADIGIGCGRLKPRATVGFLVSVEYGQ